MEDYLHNMCAFPKAAHDDDVDATSQALIYMRSRLGGGIVDFYRRQATGEAAPSRIAKLAERGSRNSGPQAGSPESAAFARAGVEIPSPANKNLSLGDSALTRSVLAAVAAGSQIQCHYKQYPEIRAALSKLAENKSENQDEPLALLAMNEIERLDLCF